MKSENTNEVLLKKNSYTPNNTRPCIQASITRGEEFKLSDRTYMGRNPEYTEHRAHALAAPTFTKTRKGVPFVRVS